MLHLVNRQKLSCNSHKVRRKKINFEVSLNKHVETFQNETITVAEVIHAKEISAKGKFYINFFFTSLVSLFGYKTSVPFSVSNEENKS